MEAALVAILEARFLHFVELTLTDDGEGGTTILTEETQRGVTIRLMAPLLRPAMRNQHQRWADNLARIAESGQRP